MIELNVDAYIPSDYIRDEKQKIEIYKKIRAIRTLDTARDLEEEIEDRFGDLPRPVQNLLRVARLHAYAIRYNMEEIKQNGYDIVIRLHPDQNQVVDGQRLFRVIQNFHGRIPPLFRERIGITFRLKGIPTAEGLEMVEQFLIQYETVPKTKGAVRNAANE